MWGIWSTSFCSIFALSFPSPRRARRGQFTLYPHWQERWKQMAFIVLEGFSGTGKTSLASGLERQGWLRLQESAHAVPKDVPVADRADTPADFSLLGATMVYSSIIS